MNSNIIFLGNSKILISAILESNKDSNYTIIPWRLINKNVFNIENIIVNKKIDIIVICGYDYDSYSCSFRCYYKRNIQYVYTFINKFPKDVKIIYFNTNNDFSKYTLSRYKFAKWRLKIRLLNSKRLLFIVNLNTLIINNKLSINGNKLNQILFKLLHLFKLLSTTSRNELIELVSNIKFEEYNTYNDKAKMKPIMLDLPRTQFIDRLLRFFYA